MLKMCQEKIRARFLFIKEASITNSKTTVLKIKHFQIENDKAVYAFPNEFQEVSHHTELMKTKTAERIKNSLTHRHERANPFFALGSDLQKIYLDEDGNPVFKNILLKEVDLSKPSSENLESTVSCLDQKPLSVIMKDAVLDKFVPKTCSASVWLDCFVSECIRLGVTQKRYYEALRLFLTEAAAEWYNATNLLLKSTTWEQWEQAFLHAFSPRGWSLSNSAFDFKWLSGSLSDYALRKFSLLVSYNPKMDEATRIALIVHGLPISVQEKIEPNVIEDTGTLFAKINSLERISSRVSSFGASRNKPETGDTTSKFVKKPCPYCEKRGFVGRFHPESECKQKYFDNLKVKNRKSFGSSNPIADVPDRKSINSTESAEILNEINAKNL